MKTFTFSMVEFKVRAILSEAPSSLLSDMLSGNRPEKEIVPHLTAKMNMVGAFSALKPRLCHEGTNKGWLPSLWPPSATSPEPAEIYIPYRPAT